MVNRFTNLLEKRTRILYDLEHNPKRKHPKYVADLTMGLKRVNWTIANFGCRERIVKVDVVFKELLAENNIEEKTITIFYTGITQSEAVEVIRNGFGNRLIRVDAVEVPVGKPITMVN